MVHMHPFRHGDARVQTLGASRADFEIAVYLDYAAVAKSIEDGALEAFVDVLGYGATGGPGGVERIKQACGRFIRAHLDRGDSIEDAKIDNDNEDAEIIITVNDTFDHPSQAKNNNIFNKCDWQAELNFMIQLYCCYRIL